MVSKVHLYLLCVAFGLSIFLIFAGSHYTDNSYSLLQSDSSSDFKFNEDYVNEDMLYYNSTNIDRILRRIRKRILYETSKNMLKHEDIRTHIPEEGGQPIRTVIVSTWRSGTTFMGEILDAVPGNFYHYEPLLSFEVVQIRGLPLSDPALERLRNMMNCDFANMPEYFEYGRKHMFQFGHNKWLFENCKVRNNPKEKNLCLDSEFTSKLCKLFPFQSMKIVRLRLHLMEELLQDNKLNIKVIFLVRDPRGVMQSRQHREFCPPSPDCWEPELLCSDMINDYVAATRLLELFPNRLLIVRYDDLALYPVKMNQRIFQFLNMSMPPSVSEFIQSHTNTESSAAFSTFRLSQNVPFKWKYLLDYNTVEKIQNTCSEAMYLWGYQAAYNESHLKSKNFNPLLPYEVV